MLLVIRSLTIVLPAVGVFLGPETILTISHLYHFYITTYFSVKLNYIFYKSTNCRIACLLYSPYFQFHYNTILMLKVELCPLLGKGGLVGAIPGWGILHDYAFSSSDQKLHTIVVFWTFPKLLTLLTMLSSCINYKN